MRAPLQVIVNRDLVLRKRLVIPGPPADFLPSWSPSEERSRTPWHLVPRHMNSRLMVLCHRRSHVYGATRPPRPTPVLRWT